MPAILVLIPLLLFLAPPAGAAESRFQVTRLSPDLLMLSTDQGSYSNNSLVFTGEDGVLLVDTHGDADAEALKEFVLGLGRGAPKYIINTHRHVEHIGGNAVFGGDPVVIAHELFPGKLRSGTYLFSEYPPEAYPDLTFADSLSLRFNGETIRLVAIGGSHDDNEIMVHFTRHGVAHVSSVVNGFNFPSIDRDGDLLAFEPITRRLMALLPPGVRLVSGHNGRERGFDFVGSWDQLEPYADMIGATIALVRRDLAAGRTLDEMQADGLLDDYEQYAGSYVDTDRWTRYLFKRLSEPGDDRDDVCGPLYDAWKREGAQSAVDLYRDLRRTRERDFDFHETVLLGIGSVLLDRGRHADACTFLLGCADEYPDGEYVYYTHYLAARCLRELGRRDEARAQCRRSLEHKAGFAGAAALLEELGEESPGR